MFIRLLVWSSCTSLKDVRIEADSFWMTARSSAMVLAFLTALMNDLSEPMEMKFEQKKGVRDCVVSVLNSGFLFSFPSL